MQHSIGEVSRLTGIAISTLRYYDREGLFPEMARSAGGIRVFSDAELETLEMIECLKMTDMPIKDIKQFLDWVHQGDSTLELRRDMFYERLAIIKQKMADLQQTLNVIKYKCWFYDTAVAAGSGDAPNHVPIDEMPEELRICAHQPTEKQN